MEYCRWRRILTLQQIFLRRDGKYFYARSQIFFPYSFLGSTIPVADQVAMAGSVAPPSVLVPVGVLKRQGAEEAGAGAGAEANKSVMFSDGIRPGGDLTDLDGR